MSLVVTSSSFTRFQPIRKNNCPRVSFKCVRAPSPPPALVMTAVMMDCQWERKTRAGRKQGVRSQSKICISLQNRRSARLSEHSRLYHLFIFCLVLLLQISMPTTWITSLLRTSILGSVTSRSCFFMTKRSLESRQTRLGVRRVKHLVMCDPLSPISHAVWSRLRDAWLQDRQCNVCSTAVWQLWTSWGGL